MVKRRASRLDSRARQGADNLVYPSPRNDIRLTNTGGIHGCRFPRRPWPSRTRSTVIAEALACPKLPSLRAAA
jgi:hypothetical protein